MLTHHYKWMLAFSIVALFSAALIVFGCEQETCECDDDSTATDDDATDDDDDTGDDDSAAGDDDDSAPCGPPDLCERTVTLCATGTMAECMAWYQEPTNCTGMQQYIMCNCDCDAQHNNCQAFLDCGTECFNLFCGAK